MNSDMPSHLYHVTIDKNGKAFSDRLRAADAFYCCYLGGAYCCYLGGADEK